MARIAIFGTLLLCIALFFVPTSVNAQRYYRSCSTSYCAPTVYAQEVVAEVVHEVAVPIAIPILVPATVFQYLPALQPSIGVAGQAGIAVDQTAIAAQPAQAVAVQAAQPVVTQPVQSVQAVQQVATQPMQVQQTVAALPNATMQCMTPEIERMIRERVEIVLREKLQTSKVESEAPLRLPDGLRSNLTNRQPAQKQQAPQPQQTSANQSSNPMQAVANMLAGKTCVQCHTQGDGRSVKGDTTLFVKQNGQLLFKPSVTLAQIAEVTGGQRPRMPPSANGNPNHPDALRQNEVALLRTVLASR